jgi:hypothetical protein
LPIVADDRANACGVESSKRLNTRATCSIKRQL